MRIEAKPTPARPPFPLAQFLTAGGTRELDTRLRLTAGALAGIASVCQYPVSTLYYVVLLNEPYLVQSPHTHSISVTPSFFNNWHLGLMATDISAIQTVHRHSINICVTPQPECADKHPGDDDQGVSGGRRHQSPLSRSSPYRSCAFVLLHVLYER
jgi:hypothetical protein